jgi:hypothetical protein
MRCMELTEALVTEDITPFERERLREALEEEVRRQLPADRQLLRVVDCVRPSRKANPAPVPSATASASPGECRGRLMRFRQRDIACAHTVSVFGSSPFLSVRRTNNELVCRPCALSQKIVRPQPWRAALPNPKVRVHKMPGGISRPPATRPAASRGRTST